MSAHDHLTNPLSEDLDEMAHHLAHHHGMGVNGQPTWARLALIHADMHRKASGATPPDDLIGSGTAPDGNRTDPGEPPAMA